MTECGHRPPLPPGARVHHYTEQYGEARQRGTATVVEVLRHYCHIDGTYEYRVRLDTGEEREWNHVEAVRVP